MSVYFGGSRHPQNINPAQIAAVVAAVVASGESVHVGCQFGADQAVLQYIRENNPSAGHVFTVGSNLAADQNHHVIHAIHTGVKVTYSAGGTTAPMKARYLLRSIAAFQGCAKAVFFSPGAGSLAVAGHAVKAGLSVFAFSQSAPAPLAGLRGQWCITWFHGFQCWGWGRLSSDPAQLSFF